MQQQKVASRRRCGDRARNKPRPTSNYKEHESRKQWQGQREEPKGGRSSEDNLQRPPKATHICETRCPRLGQKSFTPRKNSGVHNSATSTMCQRLMPQAERSQINRCPPSEPPIATQLEAIESLF